MDRQGQKPGHSSLDLGRLIAVGPEQIAKNRGGDQYTYACANRCEAARAPGDLKGPYDDFHGEVTAREDYAQKQADATKQYANIPSQNFAPFVTNGANIPVKLEPPNAQQIYAVLDTVMAKVLTDPNANIDQLLKDAETQVNTILAAVK